MSKKAKPKKLEQELGLLEVRKRNAIMRSFAPFVVLGVLIFLKLSLAGTGIEFFNSQAVNLGLFILALVAAGITGLGTRDWRRINERMRVIQEKLR